MTTRRILVVNFTRMGDVIQSGPFLRSVKAAAGDAHLTLVVFPNFYDAASRLPMIDRVVIFDVDQLVPLLDARKQNLQAAYDLMKAWMNDVGIREYDSLYNLAHTRQSAMLCGLIQAKNRFGMLRTDAGVIHINGEWFTYLFSLMQDRTWSPYNLVEIYQRFSGQPFDRNRLEFSVRDADREQAASLLSHHGISAAKPFVVLQPGASSASRQWPTENFARLAELLLASGRQVILTGTSDEALIHNTIIRMSDARVISLAGQTPVGVLGAILERSERLISNDTGTMHIAAAVNTRTMGIFTGPAAAKDTGPYGNGHIVMEADLECAPCGYHDSCVSGACARNIAPENVLVLAQCSRSDLRRNASKMTGVRVYQTQVDEKGRYHLEPLNDTTTGLDSSLLAFYRKFWDELLDGRHESYSGMNKPADCLNNQNMKEGVRQLAEIRREGVSSYNKMLVQWSGRGLDPVSLASFGEEQDRWQEKLRLLALQQSPISPFPRYLLIKLSMLNRYDFNAYVSELRSILLIFSTGLSILGQGRSAEKRKVNMHECAA